MLISNISYLLFLLKLMPCLIKVYDIEQFSSFSVNTVLKLMPCLIKVYDAKMSSRFFLIPSVEVDALLDKGLRLLS